MQSGAAGWVAVAAMLLGMAGAALAQAGQETAETPKQMVAELDPSFEVATIKPIGPKAEGYGFHLNGRHVFCNTQSVQSLIRFAYGVSEQQIVGGPEWTSRDFYDVDGVADASGQPSQKQMLAMYQKLLASRFQLSFHREKRELPVYAITMGKNGMKLAKTLDERNTHNETASQDKTGLTVHYMNSSMEEFAASMQSLGDGRPVVDQTRLVGRYDFTLKWSRGDGPNSDPNAAPELREAIQEQLGLKLEPVKAPVDVIVIDHVERPSAN
jgi:uncharacterized protein (TIGR03435 family)